jgi:hypothetical protein
MHSAWKNLLQEESLEVKFPGSGSAADILGVCSVTSRYRFPVHVRLMHYSSSRCASALRIPPIELELSRHV